MPHLAKSRQAVAADLPGFGESPPAGTGFDLGEVADALAADLPLRLETPFDLAGNSLGGAVAVTLALRRPDLVRRLVLIAPAGFKPSHPAIAGGAGAIGGHLIALRRMVGPALAGSATARRVLLWGAVSDPARLSPTDARLMHTASHGASAVPAAIASVLTADLRPRLADLRVGLGLIWGEDDRVISTATLRSIRALAPSAPVVTLPGTGHVPQIERPRQFAVALERILDRLAP